MGLDDTPEELPFLAKMFLVTMLICFILIITIAIFDIGKGHGVSNTHEEAIKVGVAEMVPDLENRTFKFKWKTNIKVEKHD